MYFRECLPHPPNTPTPRFYKGWEGLEAAHSTRLWLKALQGNKAFISEGQCEVVAVDCLD